MEKRANGLGPRPMSAARDRPEFGFSILDKGAHHRKHSTNQPSPSRSPKHNREPPMRRSSSFCGNGERMCSSNKMRRPKTHPELLPRSHADRPPISSANFQFPQEPGSKLLVNVTVQQSIGALRILVSKDATVSDVIRAALLLYAKEGRRPLLGTDPASFALHYSQFTMDGLSPTERIRDLGSRNFFLCPEAAENARMGVVPAAASCGTEMGQVSRIRDSWCRVMDCFLLLP